MPVTLLITAKVAAHSALDLDLEDTNLLNNNEYYEIYTIKPASSYFS